MLGLTLGDHFRWRNASPNQSFLECVSNLFVLSVDATGAAKNGISVSGRFDMCSQEPMIFWPWRRTNGEYLAYFTHRRVVGTFYAVRARRRHQL